MGPELRNGKRLRDQGRDKKREERNEGAPKRVKIDMSEVGGFRGSWEVEEVLQTIPLDEHTGTGGEGTDNCGRAEEEEGERQSEKTEEGEGWIQSRRVEEGAGWSQTTADADKTENNGKIDETGLDWYNRLEGDKKNTRKCKGAVKVLGRDFHLGEASRTPDDTMQGRKVRKVRRRGKKLSADEKEEDKKASSLISGWMLKL